MNEVETLLVGILETFEHAQNQRIIPHNVLTLSRGWRKQYDAIKRVEAANELVVRSGNTPPE